MAQNWRGKLTALVAVGAICLRVLILQYSSSVHRMVYSAKLAMRHSEL